MGVEAAPGVLRAVGGADTEFLAPQPAKSKGSRRQGTVRKRFREVVKIERFRGEERRDFMDAPRSIRRACTLPISKLLD
jgi:hypothetical protein